MAGILPQDKVKEAKAWLHDVFVWGGAASTPKRSIPIDKYRYMYGTHAENFRKDDRKYRDAAVTVCGCIKNRQVETQRFLAFDAAIKLLAQCSFLPDLNANRGYVREDARTLCNFIAWFCDENKLVYNNRNTSVEEMKQINGTLIGSVLWDNYLYAKDHTPESNPNKATVQTSGPVDTETPAASTASATPTPSNVGTATATTVKTGGPAGHTLYRKNAAGILTTGKLTGISNNGYVYWIGGEFIKPGATQPKLHVKPQQGSSPLKVDYGSGQGYNDCILYFASEGAAKNFMAIADANKPASKVKALHLKKIGEDKNGYVEVATEFGNAYIKASKLHEEVEEELTEDKKENKVSNKEIAEAYFDGFFKD